jgi:hypothetical protein
MTKTARRQAALKAWETIRANRISNRQREAAYKAWETMRAAAAARSAAAYQAWDTRDGL